MKKYFITGLLIWIPLVITIWVLNLIVSTMDSTLLLLPEALQPQTWLGFHVPGLGVVLTLVVLFLTGVFAANIIGERLVSLGQGLLARIPVVKTIYNSVEAGLRHPVLQAAARRFARRCWFDSRTAQPGL